MKAISLWQPWASLMAWQEKENETRGWNTNYRGPLAIHATATWKKEATEVIAGPALRGEGLGEYETFMKVIRKHPEVFPEGGFIPKDFSFPLGAVLGVCELTDCIPVDEYLGNHSVKYQELAFGDYSPGRYVWTTKWIETFEKPIPAKGAQGFWNWDEKQK